MLGRSLKIIMAERKQFSRWWWCGRSCVESASDRNGQSGVGVALMGVTNPEFVMKSIVPVFTAGVLGIYGLIIVVIISTGSLVSTIRPSLITFSMAMCISLRAWLVALLGLLLEWPLGLLEMLVLDVKEAKKTVFNNGATNKPGIIDSDFYVLVVSIS